MRITKEKIDNCSNWIAALILCFHFVNGAVGISGISVVNIAFISVLLFFSLSEKNFLINKHIFFLIIGVIFIFLLSICRIQNATYTISYMGYFLAFGVVSLLAGALKVDVKIVVENILYVGIVGLCFYLFRGFDGLASSTTMGMTYSMCPILFSAIIALINYKKKRLIAGACTILSLYIFVQHAPRGLWLTIVFFAFFCCFYKVVQSRSAFKTKIKKIGVIITVLVLVCVLINNLIEIVMWVDSFLNNTFNISIGALKKIMYYHKQEDLLNGRNALWNTTRTYISESPFFGKGIGYFEYKNEGAYPHNILFQAMCEIGVLFGGIALLMLIIKSLKILFTTNKSVLYDRYCYSTMVITVGVVMLFFSSSYWIWIPFWYCMGNLISNNLIVHRDK